MAKTLYLHSPSGKSAALTWQELGGTLEASLTFDGGGPVPVARAFTLTDLCAAAVAKFLAVTGAHAFTLGETRESPYAPGAGVRLAREYLAAREGDEAAAAALAALDGAPVGETPDASAAPEPLTDEEAAFAGDVDYLVHAIAGDKFIAIVKAWALAMLSLDSPRATREEGRLQPFRDAASRVANHPLLAAYRGGKAPKRAKAAKGAK